MPDQFPRNKSIIVEPVSLEELEDMMLSEHDGQVENKNMVGSLHIPENITPTSAQNQMVNYARGRVVKLNEKENYDEFDVRVGDVLIYNIRATMKTDALKETVLERVETKNILAILRKKDN